MNFIAKILAKRGGKIIAAVLGSVLVGGVTSIQMLQPAVEKAADYGAKTVELYCGLPSVDRDRFRAEVNERLQALGADVRVTCPVDGGR
jgi:hypothetical protein